MILSRLLLLSLPLSVAGVTWWSAERVRDSRAQRAGDLAALLSRDELPSLDPFRPRTEADRQLMTMLHAPLIQQDAQGRIQAGLASDWRWGKRVTVWFASADAASQAAVKVNAQRAAHWREWKLESVRADQRALVLAFHDPLAGSLREVLRAAAARVQEVTIWRVESPGKAHAVHAAMLAKPKLAALVERLWFDGDSAFEMAIIGATDDYEKDLRAMFGEALPGLPSPTVSVQAQMPALEEPVLEFTLRAARFSNGVQVTNADVVATFEAMRSAQVPAMQREGFRVVRKVEPLGTDRVAVLCWRHHGPALCAWLGVPVLPKAWLEGHALSPATFATLDKPVPGAGPCVIEQRDYSSLVIRPAQGTRATMRRLTLVKNLSDFTVQLAVKTDTLELFWPEAPATTPAVRGDPLVMRRSPAQRVIEVQWNTRHPVLKDRRVRAALAAATDRSALAASSHDTAVPHTGLYLPGSWPFAPARAEAFDLKQAEHLLAEADWLRKADGMAAGPDGVLSFGLMVPQEDEALLRVAADLRMQWHGLGVQVMLKVLPRAEVERRLILRDYDAVLVGDAPEITWDVWSRWHSSGSANVTGLNNRQVDLLAEALRHEFDTKEALIRLERAQSLILEEQAVLPLLCEQGHCLLRSALSPTATDEDEPWKLSNLLHLPAK